MNNDTVIEALQQRRVILTASSGRCGTQLLSTVMSLVPGVWAEHEPLPYVDNIWWKLREKPELARRWLVKHKLPAVLRSLEQSNRTVYCETSHVLCKGFFEPLLDLGIAFDLIVLSRDPRATALSFYYLNDVPGRTKTGRRWLPSPDDESCISQLPREHRGELSDYQLCYWYVLEMELRKANYYRAWIDAGQCAVKTSLEEITTSRGFSKLLSDLGLPEIQKTEYHDYKLAALTKHNEKSSRKSFMRSRGVVEFIVKDVEKQEDRVRELINYESVLQSVR